MARKYLRSDLARDLGLSRARVTQLARRGMPLYSREAAEAWRAQHVDPARGKVREAGTAPAAGPSPAAGESLLEARRRREVADAARAELALRRERGELVELAAVRRAAARAGVLVGQAFDVLVARAAAELGPGARAVLLREADAARREASAAIRAGTPDA